MDFPIFVDSLMHHVYIVVATLVVSAGVMGAIAASKEKHLNGNCCSSMNNSNGRSHWEFVLFQNISTVQCTGAHQTQVASQNSPCRGHI